MPAKKKAVQEAEKAELARQAGLRKLAEEQERLRRIEENSRQRLEEEYNQIMDAQRQRNMEIQRAITERELKLAFESREQELNDALECKDCEVRELQARISGLKQGMSSMQQERESALRRVAMLVNELDLLQMKHVETESLIEKKDQEFHARIREMEDVHEATLEAHRELKVEHERLKRAYEEFQEKFNALQEANTAATTGDQLVTLDPQSTDAETALLLKVLNEEVEKYRETSRLLQGELDRKGRDEEKGSVLISLLNSQLDSTRGECTRLQETATDRLRQLEAVQSLLDSEREKTKSLYRDLDTAHAEATVERRQLSLEIGVHTAQVAELTKVLERTQGELANVKQQLETHCSKATEREQYDFQINVTLKGEVEQLKKDLEKVKEEFRVCADDAYTKKALLRAEIESLKVRLQKLQANSEKSERESFETIAVLRATVDRLQEEKQAVAQITEDTTRKLREDLSTACNEGKALKNCLEDLKVRSDKVEKDLFEKLLRMTANHDRLHEELQCVTSRYANREREFVENAIYANAEKETFRAKVVELDEKLAQRQHEHAHHVQEISDELVALKAKAEKQLLTHKAAQRSEEERANKAEAQVELLQKQVADLEQQVAMGRRNREEMERLMRADASELRVELNAAKRTIERFEIALGDSSYKSLREANDQLAQELGKQRTKVATLNDTIASMKVESTIMESYKEKMLSEQNEQYARWIEQHEKLKQIMNPIFYEMRSILEKNGLSTPLRRDLDAFDDAVRRLRPSAQQMQQLKRLNTTISESASSAVGETGTSLCADSGYPTLPAIGSSWREKTENAEKIRVAPLNPKTVWEQSQKGNCVNGLPRVA